MLYRIDSDGDVLAYIEGIDAAERYIRDLRRVFPTSEWECHPIRVGRPEHHMGDPIWGGECAVDLASGEMLGFQATWIFAAAVQRTPIAVGDTVPRYRNFWFDSADQTIAGPSVRAFMRGMVFKADVYSVTRIS